MTARAAEQWHGMPRSRYQELERYVRARADELGLRDWSVELKFTPLDEDGDEAEADGKCEVIYGRKHALIYLPRDFNERPRDDQRQLLIHELLHCHTDGVEVLIRSGHALAFYIGEAQVGLLRSAMHERVELAVDGIADAIAAKFPLP